MFFNTLSILGFGNVLTNNCVFALLFPVITSLVSLWGKSHYHKEVVSPNIMSPDIPICHLKGWYRELCTVDSFTQLQYVSLSGKCTLRLILVYIF